MLSLACPRLLLGGRSFVWVSSKEHRLRVAHGEGLPQAKSLLGTEAVFFLPNLDDFLAADVYLLITQVSTPWINAGFGYQKVLLEPFSSDAGSLVKLHLIEAPWIDLCYAHLSKLVVYPKH